MSDRPQILWDCSELARYPERNTGIERVVRHLGEALIERAAAAGWELVACRTDGTSRIVRLPGIPSTGDEPWQGPGETLIPRPGDVWVLADNAWDPTRLLGLSPWWREGLRVVLVQYDLVPLLQPETTMPLTVSLFSRWTAEAAGMADQFVCISSATSERLRTTLGRLAPWRSFPSAFPVVHLASTWHPGPADRPPASDRVRLLSVGTVEPRKRYDVLVDAFEAHWAAGGSCELTIVGRPGWNTEGLQKRLTSLGERESRFRWLAGANDADLRDEYLRASAYVSLSSEEGFGLPVVEAAAAGLPLILADIPVYREVAGDGALYVGPPAAGGAALLELLRGVDSGSLDLPRPDTPLAARTWGDAAGDMLEVIENLGERPSQLEQRWDRRAALALVATQAHDQPGSAGAARDELGAPERKPGEAVDVARRRRAYLEWRRRLPARIVRAVQVRNQVFRLLQQVDSRASALEARVATLAKVAPTAHAIQESRREEAEQILRGQLEVVLAEVERLIAELPDHEAQAAHVLEMRQRLRPGGG